MRVACNSSTGVWPISNATIIFQAYIIIDGMPCRGHPHYILLTMNFPRCYYLLLWILLLFPTIVHAQHEYDVWQFGKMLSLDFRNGSPARLESSPLDSHEGCAVMCDRRTGALLFTVQCTLSGDNVYNRSGRIMPNGRDILAGIGTSAQGVLIVPMPCNPQKYYLFTLDNEGYNKPTNTGSYYSIVDMSLIGGQGDVTAKNVPLLPHASERQTAVMHENGQDFWVIMHSLGGRTFYAFKVTAAGIDAVPVISMAGRDQGNPPESPSTTIGCLKSSPDGRKLALTAHLQYNLYNTSNPRFDTSLVEIYDFDPATGQVSNAVPLLYAGPRDPDNIGVYGVSFSPDGSRLYAGITKLFQWSLDTDDPDAMRASKTIVSDNYRLEGTERAYYSLQIGPDGRIYVPTNNIYLGVINHPNAKGKDCGFIDTAYIASPTNSMYVTLSLPNNIDDRTFFARSSLAGTVRVHVPVNLSATPGDTVRVPIMLEQPLDDARIQSVELSLGYNPELMTPVLPRLAGGLLAAETDRSTQGTVMRGWNLQVLRDVPGELALRMTAPAGTDFLRGSGELLGLRFSTFVYQEDIEGSSLAADLPLSVDIGPTLCPTLQPIFGRINLNFCGALNRRIELGNGDYALEGNVPNPFSKVTEFRFRLGLDGDTKLEVFDQSGAYVATVLDRHLPAGTHAIPWDASQVPSGQYQYRITSGTWTASGQLVIIQ